MEQVSISPTKAKLLPGSFVTVTVHGTNVPTGKQAYALVVTGGVIHSPDGCSSRVGSSVQLSVLALCPRNCSNRGTCQTSVCMCSKGYIGVDCSLGLIFSIAVFNSAEGKHLQDGDDFEGIVTTAGWDYFRFEVPEKNTKNLLVTVGTYRGDPDLYIRQVVV